jgi:CheY-like chemotaxis protein
MPGDRERAIAAGFQYYLTKPLSPITLLDDLLKLFDDHQHVPTVGIAAPTARDSLGSDVAPREGDFAS